MRDLKKVTGTEPLEQHNKITLQDARSSTEITLFYRDPTTDELIEFNRGYLKRGGGGKLTDNGFMNRVKFAAKVITGFNDGAFGIDGKAFSSNKESENFKADWKDLLVKLAPDVLNILGLQVFESVRSGRAEIGSEEDDANAEGSAEPNFPNS